MELETLLTAILLVPLGSAAMIALFLRRGGYAAAAVSVVAAAVILGLSLTFLLTWNGVTQEVSTVWLTLGSYEVTMGFLVNYQTATMLFIVAFVGFWIHVFSVGYMNEDESKGRFFGGLSIFMFSMLGIVLANNLIMIFVFWELVGFSSYMLIAHYWDKDYAAAASKKAFIVNRVGDFGFILGIVWTYWQYGTTNLVLLDAQLNNDASTVLGLLLACGFIGKSAQFPLHVWLTDAMAGPTPVSALIHAATMVAAGVYFMARIFFMLSPETQEVILWLCAAMTLFAGLCALGQTDIKKTLAYSTLSHLGFMGAAIGLGFPSLALLHMAMHAFFKATLFLCSGSVIHACHHEQDMFKMGGLWRKMPITTLTCILAALSIMAVPYFAGFYSKDTILSGAWLLAHTDGRYYVIYAILLLAALSTALYTGRMVWVVFFGQSNSDNAAHAKESNLFMTVPLLVLAAFSVGAAWFLEFDVSLLPETVTVALKHGYATITQADVVHHSHYLLLGLSVGVMIVGVLATFFFYGPGASEDKLQRRYGLVYKILHKHGWFDDVYDAYVVKVQQRVADFFGFLDLILISGFMVRGTAGLAGLLSLVTRSFHVGSIHGYVYWFLAGVVIFGAFAFHLI